MGCTTCTHTAGGACETKEGKLELKSLGRYFVSVFSHLRTKSHLYINIYLYIYVCLDLSLYICACTCTHTETGSHRTSSKTRNQHNKCWQRDLCMSANLQTFMVCISFFFFLLIYSSKIVTLQNGTGTDTTLKKNVLLTNKSNQMNQEASSTSDTIKQSGN